ncbi:hypothetical protein Tco_0666170 [Tanacetum coccineum]
MILRDFSESDCGDLGYSRETRVIHGYRRLDVRGVRAVERQMGGCTVGTVVCELLGLGEFLKYHALIGDTYIGARVLHQRGQDKENQSRWGCREACAIMECRFNGSLWVCGVGWGGGGLGGLGFSGWGLGWVVIMRARGVRVWVGGVIFAGLLDLLEGWALGVGGDGEGGGGLVGCRQLGRRAESECRSCGGSNVELCVVVCIGILRLLSRDSVEGLCNRRNELNVEVLRCVKSSSAIGVFPFSRMDFFVSSGTWTVIVRVLRVCHIVHDRRGDCDDFEGGGIDDDKRVVPHIYYGLIVIHEHTNSEYGMNYSADLHSSRSNVSVTATDMRSTYYNREDVCEIEVGRYGVDGSVGWMHGDCRDRKLCGRYGRLLVAGCRDASLDGGGFRGLERGCGGVLREQRVALGSYGIAKWELGGIMVFCIVFYIVDRGLNRRLCEVTFLGLTGLLREHDTESSVSVRRKCVYGFGEVLSEEGKVLGKGLGWMIGRRGVTCIGGWAVGGAGGLSRGVWWGGSGGYVFEAWICSESVCVRLVGVRGGAQRVGSGVVVGGFLVVECSGGVVGDGGCGGWGVGGSCFGGVGWFGVGGGGEWWGWGGGGGWSGWLGLGYGVGLGLGGSGCWEVGVWSGVWEGVDNAMGGCMGLRGGVWGCDEFINVLLICSGCWYFRRLVGEWCRGVWVGGCVYMMELVRGYDMRVIGRVRYRVKYRGMSGLRVRNGVESWSGAVLCGRTGADWGGGGIGVVGGGG